MRRILFLFLTFTLLATACSGDDPVAEGTDDPSTSTTVQRNDDGEVVVEIDGDELVLTSGLSGFGDCDALLTHLRTEAAERVGPYGFDGGGWYGPVFARGFDTDDMAVEEADDDMAEESADFAQAESATAATGGDDLAVPFRGASVEDDAL